LVLSRADILQYVSDRRLVIEPEPPEDHIRQVSIDLTLGRSFLRPRSLPEGIGFLHIDALWTRDDLWDRVEADRFLLEPGQFVIGQTLERVSIPPDLVGLIEGRSSWGRMGIAVHVTAPKIDPGFDGHIALELSHAGSAPIELRAGVDTPAQLMLLQLTTPISDAHLYGRREDEIFPLR
jgi:dCTP deaminase